MCTREWKALAGAFNGGDGFIENSRDRGSGAEAFVVKLYFRSASPNVLRKHAFLLISRKGVEGRRGGAVEGD